MTWHPDMPEEYKNQIVTGDARELAKRIPDESIDLILWDPDYGVGMDYGGKAPSRDEAIFNLLALLKEMRRTSKNGQAIVFWSGSAERVSAFYQNVPDVWPIHYMGIWYKPTASGPSGNGLARRFEIWFWLKDGKQVKGEWHFLPDVIKAVRVHRGRKEAVAHPSQKPVALLEQLIRFFSRPGDVICDPTIGSGSTAVAAKLSGRNFVGFEINSEYSAMARKRVRNTQPPLFVMEPEQLELPK